MPSHAGHLSDADHWIGHEVHHQLRESSVESGSVVGQFLRRTSAHVKVWETHTDRIDERR